MLASRQHPCVRRRSEGFVAELTEPFGSSNRSLLEPQAQLCVTFFADFPEPAFALLTH